MADPTSDAGTSSAAVVWLTTEMANIAWPRSVGLPWWQEWAFPLGLTVFGPPGLLYFLWARPDRRFVAGGAAMEQAPLPTPETPPLGRG